MIVSMREQSWLVGQHITVSVAAGGTRHVELALQQNGVSAGHEDRSRFAAHVASDESRGKTFIEVLCVKITVEDVKLANAKARANEESFVVNMMVAK